jgi:hypothetical protein
MAGLDGLMAGLDVGTAWWVHVRTGVAALCKSRPGTLASTPSPCTKRARPAGAHINQHAAAEPSRQTRRSEPHSVGRGDRRRVFFSRSIRSSSIQAPSEALAPQHQAPQPDTPRGVLSCMLWGWQRCALAWRGRVFESNSCGP